MDHVLLRRITDSFPDEQSLLVEEKGERSTFIHLVFSFLLLRLDARNRGNSLL